MNNPANFAGRVDIALRQQDGRVVEVDLRVARPTAAAAMRGRSADEAQRLLPMLYSICGVAQGAAARLAVAAARGEAAAPQVDAAVLAEARREHLWRLLLDWPALLGLPSEEALLAEALRRLKDGSFEGWREGALRAPLDRVDAALARFDGEAMPARMLPVLNAEQTWAAWPRLDAGFAAMPQWQGQPAETGALARQGGADFSWPARVRARIAEVFEESALGRTAAVCMAPGVGRAVVETARGMLMHEAALDGERVVDYTIVAPTEWNFHREGGLAAMLAGLAPGSTTDLRAAAERAVLALDPCVRCDIEVE